MSIKDSATRPIGGYVGTDLTLFDGASAPTISGPSGLHPTAPTPTASVATGGDIPGASTARRSRELRWLDKAENWGEWLRFPDDEPGDPARIWMMRGSNGKVRFYAVGQGQVGDDHASVLAASCWAWANRWLWTDPETGRLDMPGQLECRRWVLAGGAEVSCG